MTCGKEGDQRTLGVRGAKSSDGNNRSGTEGDKVGDKDGRDRAGNTDGV